MTIGRSHHGGWDLDLAAGQAREDAFLTVLQRQKVHLVEHKDDRLARRTGKLYVEYWCNGHPSGIATTQADAWAIEIRPFRWVVIQTDELKALARLAWQQGLATKGGDFNGTRGALVPLAWLVEPIREVGRAA